MAFGFKNPFDKIMDMYGSLSDDDKLKFKNSVMDIEKAEDEREIDSIEEQKADDTAVAEDKAEDVAEESAEIGKDIDAVEQAEDVNEPEQVETEEAPADVDVSAPETQVEVPDNETTTELNEAPSIDIQAMQTTLDGMNAKYSELEGKFNDLMQALAERGLTEKDADVGLSGYGKSDMAKTNSDERVSQLIKTLGGMA